MNPLFIPIYFLLVFLHSLVHGTSAWNVTSCPYSCTCVMVRSRMLSEVTLKSTDCSDNGLRHFPQNVSRDSESLNLSKNKLHLGEIKQVETLRNLTELNLADNIVYTIDILRLNLPKIQYLCLDDNEIGYLPNRSFSLFQRLQWLSIRDNRIEMINIDAFHGVYNLESLDLSGNRLYEVNPVWFKDLYYLERLHLQRNNIHGLGHGAFGFAPRMRYLDLSENRLTFIQDSSFDNLISLETLNLAQNFIHTVPSKALQAFPHIQYIDISQNHIHSVPTGSFTSVNVTHLKLNSISSLKLIESGAFKNLLYLEKLELSQNLEMRYFDKDALINVPRLRNLQLKNNNLSAIDRSIVKHLKHLQNMYIGGNPIICDCNMEWIVDNTTNVTIDTHDTICAKPIQLKGHRLNGLEQGAVGEKCPPIVIGLFRQVSHAILGDDVTFECRAIGTATPRIEWKTPSGVVLHHYETHETTYGVSKPSHFNITKHGGLTIDYIVAKDQGVYTCAAVNNNGRSEVSVVLNIKNTDVHVMILRVGATSITVTWSGVRHDYHHRYDLMYKPKSTVNSTYQKVIILPYMRSFTANSLTPELEYKLCVAIEHNGAPIIVNCTVVTTRKEDVINRGIFNGRSYIVGFGIVCGTLTFIFMCVIGIFIRRYNRRTRQAESLYTDSMSQLFMGTIDNMSDTTPITYENRGAEIFDDDDIAEIRSAAATHAASTSTTVIIK